MPPVLFFLKITLAIWNLYDFIQIIGLFALLLLSHFSCVRLFATPGTVDRQAPLSMGFSRQEYWSGLPFPPLGIFPNQALNPCLHLLSLLHCRWILYPLSHLGSPIEVFAAATAKSLQSCLTLCDPIDGSPLGSPIPGILLARTLEWVAISSSNA